MKMSHAWLRELCPHEADAQTVADKLTAAGLEVEDVEAAAEPLDGVVVARIIEAKQHPNADRLRVCMVDAGVDEPLQIVCGAPNAREGLVTALATIGTRLPGDFKIKKGKLRGEVSMGMLCAASELGMDGSDGIMELPSDLSPGTAIIDALGLDDHIFDIALTPNRGDCLSATGIARELGALGLGSMSPIQMADVAVESNQQRSISIENPKDCASYYGRVIEGLDRSKPTPSWMIERLRRCGLRSLGPLVDVTNYVMLELGQPLHAFDHSQLAGDIHVRRAQNGETLALLNEQEIALSGEDLLICDDTGAQALAGAMGGASTAVTDKTTAIFLESACFSPSAVAGLGRRHKLVSDALHRFERGTDPTVPPHALERATALLIQICGGHAGPVTFAGSAEHSAKPVVLDLDRANAILGSELQAEHAQSILGSLGFNVNIDTAQHLTVRAPAWRRDIAIPEDLMEELARIVGYDNLGGSPTRVLPTYAPAAFGPKRQAQLRRFLEARGWSEIVTYSFTSEALTAAFVEDDAAERIRLANPISEQLTHMRPSLWASMLPTYVHNLRHANRDLRLFEIGRSFTRTQDKIVEHDRIAGIAGGSRTPENWNNTRDLVDFFDISGLAQDMARLTSAEQPTLVKAEHPALHPGKSAQLIRGETRIGWIGQLHPRVWKVFGEGGKAPFLFEWDWKALLPETKAAIQPIPAYPSSRRDLSMLFPIATTANQVVDYIRQNSTLPLADLLVFDVFENDSLHAGFKSVALGLIFQDFSRTLEDGVIDDAMTSLVDGLTNTFDARLRD